MENLLFPNKIKRNLVLLICVYLIGLKSSSIAQDIRSGEISYQSIGALGIQASVVIYTQISNAVNRPYILINWSDGTTDTINTQAPTVVYPNVYQYGYVVNHTFPSNGNYLITVNEPYYVSDISNISNSGSENLLLSKNVIMNPSFGNNNSPVFITQQDFDWTCCNWIHNPGAYDTDGDSLSYSLIPCNVSNYIFPNATIDSITGDLHLYPDSIGHYAISIKVDEWRNVSSHLENIGSTIRQMLLDVNSLNTINEVFDSFDFDFFPNPTSSILYISFRNQSNEKSKLVFFNSLGETVMEQSVTKDSKQIIIDVSQWAQGVYFCKLISGDAIIVKKLLKE